MPGSEEERDGGVRAETGADLAARLQSPLSMRGPGARAKRSSVEEEDKLVKLDMGMADADPKASACLASCSTAWLYPELPWGAPPTWGKQRSIHRGVHFLKFWDVLLFTGLMYVAFSVPYQIGFNSADGENVCVFDVRDQFGIIFAVLDASVDCIFTADIILNFFVARWEVSRVGTPHWELVNDLPTIRRMYLRGAFAIDIIGQIPWQYLDCVFPTVDSELKILRLLRLMKLFRLHRISRMIQALKRKFPSSELLVTALELTMTMCIVAHWMCCIWYNVGYPNGWVLTEGLTWETEDGAFTSERSFHEWISSFYWAITTMSTIGYGDISASTTLERGVASIVMVLGCGFFAWATGRLTNILTKTSICSENFETKMSQLNEFFSNRGIPEHLVDKAMSYYMLKFPTLRMFDQEQILEDLPNELQKELLVELYADVIRESPIFGVLSSEVQRELCHCIKSQFVEAGAVIMEEGAPVDAMYVVRFGYVQLSARGEELMSAQRGDVFGELELVGLTRSGGERKRTARAVTVCDLCVIRAEDWWKLLRSYPRMGKKISMMSRKLVGDLEQTLRCDRCISATELLCPRWDAAAAYARAKMSSAAQRELASASQVSSAALRLRTWLQLEFTGIEFARLDDEPMCPVFIVVTCTDENGEPGAVGESPLFSMRAGEGCRAPFHEVIKVLLFHSKNAWDTMPGLHVRVYQPRRMQEDGSIEHGLSRFYEPPPPQALERARSGGGGEREELENITGAGKNKQARAATAEPQQQPRSRASPFLSQRGKKQEREFSQRGASGHNTDRFADCQVLWEGTIELSPLIHRRDEDCTHQAFVDPPAPSARDAWAPASSATLLLKCKVLRMLRHDSRWFAVLPVLAAKGAATGSDFFKRRREQEVRAMRIAADNFGAVTTTVNNEKVMMRNTGHRLLGEDGDKAMQGLAQYIDEAVDKASFRFVQTLAEHGVVGGGHGAAGADVADARAAWRAGKTRGLARKTAGSEEVQQDEGPESFDDVVKKAFMSVAKAGGQRKGAGGGVGSSGDEEESEGEAKKSAPEGLSEAGVARLLREHREEMVRGQRAMEDRISVVEDGMRTVTQLLQTLVAQRSDVPRLVTSGRDRDGQPRDGDAGRAVESSGVVLSLRGEPTPRFEYSSEDAETPRGLLESQAAPYIR